MTRTKHDHITNEDLILLELGEFLISRYLQIEEQRAQANSKTTACPNLLKKLETLLAAFLDRSSPLGVTLQLFQKRACRSYFIEFNAAPKAASEMHSMLSTLFDTAPNPFKLERYQGTASHCLKLTQKTPRPKADATNPFEIPQTT